ncbi:hypothetical protein [Marinobacterium rhizophilum]|uniref:Uncharacterized protein n=1 Tax=Marinobacterium rhizophilum TaxID=420402 RepID=A0ABY5HRM9_9GAMM|nr:hypothetical protein [Marinobacterium rhizophilum]UTW13864.1 hypothetical protein KDW95_09600 [Marinobacterium rhizophilum]
MGELLGAIVHVTGPLTLIAFLAVVFLALFRRSVKDERGLEYLYKLMSTKLTRKDFYSLAMRALNLGFAACVLIFMFGVGAFVMIKLNEDGSPAPHPLVSESSVSGDVIAIGSGNPVVATGGSQISLGNPAPSTLKKAQSHAGGETSQIISRESGNFILSGDGSERIRVPNSGDRVDGDKRLSAAYRIDIQPGHRTTQGLRDLYDLQPLASPESMDEYDDGEFFFPEDRAGLYGFTVPWMVGEANFTHYPVSPVSAGSAVLEVHKRPSGTFALAGFLTQSEAAALAGLHQSQEGVDIELTTAPVVASRAAVSIPLARIDSILLGGTGMQGIDSGVSVVSLRIW